MLVMEPGTLVCPPRFGTPRNPDRATLGPQVGEVARRLGMPLMEWQQHVLDVILEVGDDGGLVYPEAVLTAPRQNGKTAIVLSKLVHRAKATEFFGGPQNILYTAQDRNNARKKWLDDHVKRLRRAQGFRRQYVVRLSNGSEAILWKNGSTHGICAPTDTAAHGETLDEGVIDEAFAHDDDAVEQGMAPAMITRRNRQFFVLSTAGTSSSKYLWRKILTGRSQVESGSEAIAYFEWSAADGSDPADPATWRSCNPALGITITEEALRAEYFRLAAKGQEGIDQFCRAHLNQWTEIPLLDDDERPHVIDLDLWASRKDPSSRVGDAVTFAFDVTPDRSAAAIAVASRRPDGRNHVEIIDHRSGTGWLHDRLLELNTRWKPTNIACDEAGPAGSFVLELEQAGLTIKSVSAREHSQACGSFQDAVTNDTLRHIGQPELATALDGAEKRASGDAWLWSRKSSLIDISPLVAVTLASWLVGAPGEPAKPVFAY